MHQFHTFYPQITDTYPLDGGHEIYNFLSSYLPNLDKIGPVILEKKMLNDDTRTMRTDAYT